MPARKQLVDIMFKRFDADSNGKIDASELSQVRIFTILKVSMYFYQSITAIKLKCNSLALTQANTELVIFINIYLDTRAKSCLPFCDRTFLLKDLYSSTP